jgi:hypothetical protein
LGKCKKLRIEKNAKDRHNCIVWWQQNFTSESLKGEEADKDNLT